MAISDNLPLPQDESPASKSLSAGLPEPPAPNFYDNLVKFYSLPKSQGAINVPDPMADEAAVQTEAAKQMWNDVKNVPNVIKNNIPAVMATTALALAPETLPLLDLAAIGGGAGGGTQMLVNAASKKPLSQNVMGEAASGALGGAISRFAKPILASGGDKLSRLFSSETGESVYNAIKAGTKSPELSNLINIEAKRALNEPLTSRFASNQLQQMANKEEAVQTLNQLKKMNPQQFLESDIPADNPYLGNVKSVQSEVSNLLTEIPAMKKLGSQAAGVGSSVLGRGITKIMSPTTEKYYNGLANTAGTVNQMINP